MSGKKTTLPNPMIINSYDFKARIVPAIIFLLPVVLIFPQIYIMFTEHLTILPAIYTGVALFTAGTTRYLGRLAESKLFLKWGGPPTTRFLRWGNTEYNSFQKDQCFAFFEIKKGIMRPSKSAESRNPKKADDIYESCITFLRTLSRDHTTYNLLYHENIQYGFCRNLYALKTPAILFNCFLLPYLIFVSGSFISWAVVVDISLIILWVFLITEKKVKFAAENYATRLLEICLR